MSTLQTPTPTPPLPPQSVPPQTGTIEEILGIQNDKITLGRIIQAIIKLDSEIPTEGGSLIKMIQEVNRKYNLGLDFITPPEQAKLKAFAVDGIDPTDPPIQLAQMNILAGEFTLLKQMLNGDPNTGNPGLLDEFSQVQQEVQQNSQELSAIR